MAASILREGTGTKKILYCATVDYHFKAFHLPYMKWFQDHGWEVHVAAAGNIHLPFTDKKYSLPIERTPFTWQNWKAFKALKALIAANDYQIIHCHTPLGGVLARMAAKKLRKQGTKVIYTAHGFHFSKGAPLVNWLLFYPIEKYLARFTDSLITINQEDYQLAKSRFKAEKILLIYGVGIDAEKYRPLAETEKARKRKAFGYDKDNFLLFYAGEFNKNKNQAFLIRVLFHMKEHIPGVRLLLAGEGPLLEDCQHLANELGVGQMVDFLGFTKNIQSILPFCDVALSASFREGLPVNIMEAMSSGLPIVAVANRGVRELVQTGKNGWLIEEHKAKEFSEKVVQLANSKFLRKRMGEMGRKIILERYSLQQVLPKQVEIYEAFMEERRSSFG